MNNTRNLLPYDGNVTYENNFITALLAEQYFKKLSETLPWQHDEVVMFGKKITTSRKIVWVGDPYITYKYAGVLKYPVPWTPDLVELKNKVEEISNAQFNSCLLNLYQDGSQGMGWHSDDEKELGKNNCIASISLGAPRKFAFRHKTTKDTVPITLESGSLLIMRDETQHFWHHALLKSTLVKVPRINLTFRKIMIV